jgi:hypothetical protein
MLKPIRLAAIAAALNAMLCPAAFAGQDACRPSYEAVWQAFRSAGPYRVEMMKTGSTAPTGVLRVESPDRLHFDVGPIVSGYLVYDGRLWTGKGDRWVELPSHMAGALMQQLRPTLSAVPASQALNLQCGDTVLDGATYDSFTYELEAKGASGPVRVRVRLLAESHTHRPVLRESALAGGTPTASAERFVYDPSLRITPPTR